MRGDSDLNNHLNDAYIIYKLQCNKSNILEAYFPFMANIVIENNWEEVNENKIKQEFEKKYGINVSISFIRQVLAIGIENKSIVKRYGKYVANISELSKYKIESDDFDNLWRALKKEFDDYCDKKEVSRVSEQAYEDLVFQLIDSFGVKSIIDNEWIVEEATNNTSYHWHKFIKELNSNNSELFDFVAYLSASKAYKEALFFSGDQDAKYDGLNIYLDSPMIFALLGMDSAERTEAYKKLLEDIVAKGCNIFVLDNCFEEVSGIVDRASGWATSSAYDISKANKVAKYFHDSEMSHSDIIEYCENIEDKLNELGITVKHTNYDGLSNSFQEDEGTLFEMVKNKYLEHQMSLSQEKIESINCDIKSIVMVYRERKGRTATKIQTCADIMLTTNGALANVCKQYEAQKSIQSGHIPACISADLFGAIIWLNSPIKGFEYQKKKILADCYASLQPSKQLLSKYVDSLERALKNGEIDEKKYLFLRSHSVVVDSLMDITKGDYACFDDQTYIEVYEEIEARARKEYFDEKSLHIDTKARLEKSEKETRETLEQLHNLNREFEEFKEAQRVKNEERYNVKCKRWSFVCTLIVVAIPYVIIFTVAEFYKARYVNEINIQNIIRIAGAVIITLIVPFVFGKISKLLNFLMHKIIKRIE